MKIKNKSEKLLKTNVRWQAVKLIYQIEYEKGYSNVLIDQFLKQSPLNDADNRLLVQLVYGVIQRRMTLDYYLEPFLKHKKVESWVSSLLRMSIYQQVYLNKIPLHASVNEAVQIAKINGHEGLGKFVNGVLRQFSRTPLRALPSRLDDLFGALSIEYSMSKWLVKALFEWLGQDAQRLEQQLSSLLAIPNLSARIVRPREEQAKIIELLADESVKARQSTVSPDGLIIENGKVLASTVFNDGMITIQDESSMLVAPLGCLKGNEKVLDACAAPGGKATHIAQLLTTGHLTALDLSSHKLQKVNQHLERMHLAHKVSTQVADAIKFIPTNDELYDTIYVDAPCSGLGLMRRKPEIKYEKVAADLSELATIQLAILNNVAQYLKTGGTLVYSTCTLSTIENEQLLAQFIAENDEFVIDPIGSEETLIAQSLNEQGQLKIWPNDYQTDGFFISRLIKK